MSESLHVKDLVQDLKCIESRWDILGMQLGFSQDEIRVIKCDCRENERQAMSMYDKWLRKEVNPSWIKIITALEEMAEMSLASQLKKKYLLQDESQPETTGTDQQTTEREVKVNKSTSQLRNYNYQQQDKSPQMTACEKPIAKPSLRVLELKVDRKDQVAQDLDNLKAKYFQLVTNAESALEAAKPSAHIIKRFSQMYMKCQVVTTVEELFDCLGQLCFLDYALLESVINLLLEKSLSVVADLNDYVQQLSAFKKSTTLSEFMESIEKVYSSLTANEASVCTIKIRLVGGWLEKTMEDLDRLLEEIFQDKASILNNLKIVRGSVIVKYLAPQFETASLIKLAGTLDLWILLNMGVCKVFVGRTAVVRNESKFCSFEQSLINAVNYNKIKLLKFLIDIKTDPNASQDEWLALMYGSYNGQDEAVKLLLKANANPNFYGDSVTPLYLAAQQGHLHVISALLEAKADPCLCRNGFSPLFIAAYKGHTAIVDVLLQVNVNPNIQYVDGSTPLFVAAQNGCFDTVKVLLLANANPNLTNFLKISPIFTASQFGHTHIVKLLLNAKADPNQQREDGATPLYIAAFMGYAAIVGALLHFNSNPNIKTVRSGTTPIYMAAQNGRSDIVYMLLIANANPNILSDDGTTPLFIASQFGYTGTVNILLHGNANPNFQKDGITPIFMASQCGHSDIVNILLKYKADPNLQRVGGASPLYQATAKGQCDIVSSLLRANANPNIQTDDGGTSLYMAAQAGRSDIVDILLKANADPNLQNKQGVTPLCIASQEGHINTVRILLKANANPNIQTTNNTTTPLMSACLHCYPAVVHLLLKNGANPNLCHSVGTTALMLATYAGCYESVKLLLKFGADLNIVGPNRLTAFIIAVNSGHIDIADLMKITSSASTDTQVTTEISKANTSTATKAKATVTVSGSTSVDNPAMETAKIDNESMELLLNAIEKIYLKKVESFILAQDKLIDKNIQSKSVQEPKIISPKMHADYRH